MITFRLGMFQNDVERARELCEAIKRQPGSCDVVWLCAMGYYPVLDKHREYAKNWREVAKIFRDAGIRVSLHISNTLGHRDWADTDPAVDNPFFHGMREGGELYDLYTGPTGIENNAVYCWNGEKFRKYIYEAISIYAEATQPERVWIDDDMRAYGHGTNRVGCFCDRCIAKFNLQNGTKFTREELSYEMNYGDISWREKYVDFCREGLYDFTRGIVSAVLKVSPDSAFGMEYGHFMNYTKNDDNFFFAAMHDGTGKEVHTRPGGGYYNDKSPFGQFTKLMILSHANALIPDYVTHTIAEIENLPGVAFGKSIGGIINEGTIDLAIGCSGLSFTDVQSVHEPMSYYERIFAEFSRIRPYWERLSEIAKKYYRGGVSVFQAEKRFMRKISEKDTPFLAWCDIPEEKDYNLLRLGVPMSFDTRRPSSYVLHSNIVDTLTDEEIEFLLTKPVLTDGEAVDKLAKRGYGDRFPLRAVHYEKDGYEIFTSHKINGEKCGNIFNENPYAGAPMKRYLFEDLDGRTEVLGIAHTHLLLDDGSPLGPCTVITEINGTGAKWALFGYSLWNDIVSSAKRNQVLEAFDYISPLPAKLLSEEAAVVIPSVNECGECVSVTVSSATQSPMEDFRLLVRRPAGKKISTMGTRRESYGFECEEKDCELLIKLDSLAPYETVTIFFD